MSSSNSTRGVRPGAVALAWLPALAWMGLIFVGSAQPDFDFAPDIWRGEPLSLTAHAVEYGVLALLLWLAASRTSGLERHALLFAFVAACLYGLSDEFHQVFVPGRVADVRDVLADALGAAFALWLAKRLATRRFA